MKRLLTLLLLGAFCLSANANMIITGIMDGPLTGGTKAIEVYVVNDIPDLSIYGFGIANNGGGTDGQEYTMPVAAATAGSFLYFTNSDANFLAYMGFSANYVDANIGGFNGNDAVELYENGAVLDIFGNVSGDGATEGWDFLDSWVYRVNGTGPDGDTFVPANWSIQPINLLDNSTTNDTSNDPFPFGTYVYTAPTSPVVSFFGNNASVDEAAGTVSIDITIASEDANPTSVDIMVDAASTADAADYSLSATTVTFPGGSNAAQTITVTINDDATMETVETIVLQLANPTNAATLGSVNTYTISISDNDTPIPPIVITEIMYNVPSVDSLEFIELYNNGTDPVDLNGATISNAITHAFATSTVINPGEYLVLCNNSTAFFNAFGMNVAQWDFGTLNNTGETIELHDASGNLVDMVTYDDGTTFPSAADGTGPSLELCSPDEDNANPVYWFASTNATGVVTASGEVFGTPGAANSITCPDVIAPTLRFVGNGIQVGEADGSVTVQVAIANNNDNPTNVTVSVDGTSSATDAMDYTYTPATLTFPAGVVADTQSVTINIIDDADMETLESLVLALTGNDNGSELVTDSTYVINIADNDTPPAQLVITEIMYNVPSVDSLEFIEIYNAGDTPVDLLGASFAGAVTFTWDFTQVLAPGDYAVVAGNNDAFFNAFGFLVPQWAGGLNNTGETIELYDGSGNLVDVVTYDDGATFPGEADGTGPSLELCSPDEDNSDPFFWFPSITASGVMTSAGEVFASPGAANGVTCTEIVPTLHFLTDGMQVDESAGTVTIDVAIFNGDANPTSVMVAVDAASTATDAMDYVYTPATLTFPGGVEMDTMSFTVDIVDDMDLEGLENIVFALTGNDNNSALAVDSTYTLNIADNDTPPATLVITEIMYNLPGADSLEFIEIHNFGADAIDLMGVTLANAVDYTYTESMILNAGDYTVVCNNSTAFMNAFGITAPEWAGTLNNTGETIYLYDGSGNLVDSVAYDDGATFPGDADGFGPSLELCSVDEDNNDPFYWFPSTTSTGLVINNNEVLASPGMANDVACTLIIPTLSFIEGSMQVDEAAGTVTIGVGLIFGDANPTSVMVAVDAASTATDAMDYVYTPATLTFPGGVETDTMSFTVDIIDDMDVESVESIVFALTGNDNGSVLVADSTFMLNITDNDSDPATLMITEIMYNNPSTDSLEFVEIYNYGTEPVDLLNASLANAVDYTYTESTILNPGEYTVICGNSTAFMNAFGIAAPQWPQGTGLNNTGETIYLYDGNGNLVDSVAYDDGATFPSDADGFGPSLELCDLTADNSNNAGDVWFPSITPTGVISGAGEILATPGMANTAPCFALPDPTISFEIDTASVDEAAGTVDVNVTITDGDVVATTVTIAVGGSSTATEGVDYSLSTTTLTFAGGVSSETQSITVNITDDAETEPTETVVLGLSGDNNAQIGAFDTYTLSILDNDPISTSNPLSGKVALFPNPASGLFVVDASVHMDAVEVVNVLGQTVLNTRPNANRLELDAANWAPGVYFVRVTSDEAQISLQLVVE